MLLPKTLLALLAVAALSACASMDAHQLVPRPSEEVDVTSPNVCRIYLARAGQTRGALRQVKVIEDDREIGTVGASEYLCWERAPGRRILRLIFEGRVIDSGNVETVISSDGVAGEVLYLQVGLGVGAGEPDPVAAKDKPYAIVLSAAEGRALIGERTPAPLK